MTNAQIISEYRPLLQAIAYNLLRCKEDAEDIVQETFLKWLSVEPAETIQNTKAYLIKSVTNASLNHLKSLKIRKTTALDTVSEAYHKIKEINLGHLDFEVNVNAALHVLSTKLEPLERAVFILKEAFDFDYDSLQQVLDKKKDHCRQLFSRASKKLSAETNKINFPTTTALRDSFRQTCEMGNIQLLIQVLRQEVGFALKK